MHHPQAVSSMIPSESMTDNDHSPLSFDELKKLFLKLNSMEFDIDVCKAAFSDCMTSNVNRTNFPQELLKRTIQLTPKSFARNVICNNYQI